jgi:23S rRNA (cytosine1962-C5)-methyltransferase
VSDYELLDSGSFARLERFGEWILHRPSPQAFWNPRHPELWAGAHARYERSSQGGGSWVGDEGVPESWLCRVGDFELELRRTGFGHLGVFTEQIPFWRWITATCADAPDPLRVLNLFAYTGGSSLAAARGGAEVTHCDASKGVVQWASENAARNETPGNIRWIVDDAIKFLRREERRGNLYDAIILDPPSFGRGPRGEVFKLEEGARELMEGVVAVLDPHPSFVLLSAHTPGLGPIALRNLLEASLAPHPAAAAFSLEHGEMAVEASGDGFTLPAGTWARATRS